MNTDNQQLFEEKNICVWKNIKKNCKKNIQMNY